MIFEPPLPEQRFFAPEVVQTSAMDCGPAALKSILEGFRIPVSYGRLREACQTDVDGTSINTVEDIATQLGLRAEQVMLPFDHLAMPEAQALPAIVVVQRPSGLTHFLVVWSRVGNFLQVMDPATGRRWPTWKQFQDEIYRHSFPVPTEAWREWAGSEGMGAPLQRRIQNLGLESGAAQALFADAASDKGWRSLATLDAAVRMTQALVEARGIARGEQAGRVLERFYRLNLSGPLPKIDRWQPEAELVGEPNARTLMIPGMYWSVLPAIETEAQAQGEEPVERLILRGAVLVRILGRQAAEPGVAAPPEPEVAESTSELAAGSPTDESAEMAPESSALPPDLRAALDEPTYNPEKAVWESLRADGLLTPSLLVFALFLATTGVLIEALLFQGLIRIGQSLTLPSQKAGAVAALLGFLLALMAIELPISATVLRMGRRLEVRLRMAFLEKIPRLGDRYFRSRLTSDMTQRAYDLRSLRSLPALATGVLRSGFQLILTTIGVIWLDPISAPLAVVGTVFFVGLSFITRPFLEERDLRLRTHTGALSRFYLDSLMGLIPVRTHAAERAMRRQHETQLFEWVRTGRDTYNIGSIIQALGALLYSLFAILILINYIAQRGEAHEILLLFYWTLSLPALGQAVAEAIQQYPMQRNMILRLLEPLGAPDEEDVWSGQPEAVSPWQENGAAGSEGVGVAIENVTLQAGGHVILEDINLVIEPGEHVAIIGPSGAGKSSLVGLLLGWHRPSSGRLLIDGAALDGPGLKRLRRATAWVDPAIQIWNVSLYDNLRYGIEGREARPISEVIQSADLYDVLERLPEGLKTDLGEGGGLVSGGEGQRVRLGRAMLRGDVRLVVLDEPFRGLDRQNRSRLLREARRHWAGQTLLCATHDIGETRTFPRVLVIENGKIIEDGSPDQLAAQSESRYRAILEAEAEVRSELWESIGWRRLVIERGELRERQDD